MKKLFFILAFIAIKATATPFAKKDTTIVEFDDKTSNSKVKVITGKKTFELPKSLNLNNILKAIGVDSAERNRAIVLVSKGNGKDDTLLVLSNEGQKIKIITKEMKKDSTNREARTVIKKVPDANDSRTEEEIAIDANRDANRNAQEEKDLDYAPKKADNKPHKFFSRSDFGLYLGINGLRNTDANNTFTDLRTWRSRYVALSFRKNATLVKGRSADLAFSYGPEIAWYNFMFDNSNVARYENGQVNFIANTKATEKSKLVVPYVNFPVLLNIGFKEEKFKIGFGGYIGYRVGGYTKEKFASGGKNKTQGSYGLEKPVYGLTAEIGKKGGWTIFGRYDMSQLFKSNQTNAKDLQAFSVGFRL
jgi:hypothetical protein